MSLFRKKKSYDLIQKQTVTFLCEQDGIAEVALKSDFVRLFESMLPVQRAYLVRVDYGNPNEYNVALALRCASEDKDAIVKAVSKIFGGHMAKGVYLDTLFLSDKQEAEVRAVATPFFDRAALG